MKKLERKGIIQHQSDSANCSYYLVTEKYSHFMKLFWNSRVDVLIVSLLCASPTIGAHQFRF